MENTENKKEMKMRTGSGYLKQLYSTARNTSANTHSHFKNLTTFLVNFVPVDKIDASELQVRTVFDEDEIQALSQSVKQHGVLQPILVVQNGDRYKVIAGERRLRASRLAGLERIPARVLTTDDNATHEIALRENLDRVDLHPIEEGEGFLSLLETQAFSSHEAIAKAFGKPKSRITECIGFTRLPEDTKKALLKQNIKNRAILRQLTTTPPERHAELIAAATGIGDGQEIPLAQLAGLPEGESKATPQKKREVKPWQFACEEKGIIVPTYKWKAGEGRELLENYVQSLYQLIEKIEQIHLNESK